MCDFSAVDFIKAVSSFIETCRKELLVLQSEMIEEARKVSDPFGCPGLISTGKNKKEQSQ